MQKIVKNQGGFTLIELMIVVAIIGILAAVAIPQYQNFTKKSKASEAKVILDAIVTAEAAYYAEQDVYTTTQANLGTPAQGARYYAYSVTVTAAAGATPPSFTALATPVAVGTSAGLTSSWRLGVDNAGTKTKVYPAQGF